MINFYAAIQALWLNRFRTLLSGLGVLIGVASIILLVSIAQGVKNDVTGQVEQLGVNVIVIVPGKIDSSNPFNPMSVFGISTLKVSDVNAAKNVPGVIRATPMMFVAGGASRENELAPGAFVIACEPEWFRIRPSPPSEGTLFDEAQMDEAVCVLADIPRRQLFGDAPAIGQTVSLQGRAFKVIGVLAKEKTGSAFGSFGFENVVYTPLKAMQRASKQDQIHRVLIQTRPDTPPQAAMELIRQSILKNHGGKEDFSVITQEDLLKLIYQVMNILTYLLSGVSSISLVVGGIGIMNVMLMSVTQRTREIGIRKTVGAKRSDLFFQFLFESIFLSVVGGALGVLLAAGLNALIAAYTPIKPVITSGILGMAFGVCAMVGIGFGLLPAMRAALKDPVESLRHE